jgi:hypothetical protein
MFCYKKKHPADPECLILDREMYENIQYNLVSTSRV